jgi:sugar phosphate isomerase/epimerase
MSTDYDVGFISANYVARAAGYPGGSIDDWGDFDEETREEADLEDFESWIGDVADLDVDGLSMWTAHCFYHDVTDETVDEFGSVLDDHGLKCYSYAGGLGIPEGELSPREAWDRTFAVADRLGCSQLAGGCGEDDWDHIRELGAEYGVDFAYENHPEESAAAIREQIEPAADSDVVGIAFDTGWAGTQGYDAPETIRERDEDLIEVHLKDVVSEDGHETCALGEGIVDIEGCLDALDDIDFDGWVTIEHEPFDRDPLPEVEESLELVRQHR